jgi:hypothetical protein
MRALLLFCEGKHEVELLRRLMHEDLKTGWGEHKASLKEYPSPLGSFLTEKLAARPNVGDKKLSELTQHDPPQLAYVNKRQDGSALMLLYRMQGEQQREAALAYLKDVKEIISLGGFASAGSEGRARVSEWTIGMLLDADKAGDDKLKKWQERLAELFGEVTLADGAWCSTPSGVSVGVLLLRERGEQTGTLESILENALVEHYREKLPLASEFLVSHKPERKSELFRGDDAVAQRARLLKASFVVLGQYDRPDQGLSTIIGHGDLFDTRQLAEAPSLARLLSFIALGCAVEARGANHSDEPTLAPLSRYVDDEPLLDEDEP